MHGPGRRAVGGLHRQGREPAGRTPRHGHPGDGRRRRLLHRDLRRRGAEHRDGRSLLLVTAAPEAPPAEHVAGRLSTLDRFLPVWIGVAMVVGLLLGRVVPGLGGALSSVEVQGVSLPIAARAPRDDVPGPGQGPLRPPRHRDRGPAHARRQPGPELGARARADVRPRLAPAARPARVPHRADHRGARPLHRHGHHLERPGVRRPRGRGRPGRDQLALPGRRVRRARLVLPLGAPRVAGPGAGHPLDVSPLAGRRVGARCSSGSRCSLGYLSRRSRREALGERVVRGLVPSRVSAPGRSTGCSSPSSCSSRSRASGSRATRSTSPGSPCPCSPTSR